ncbi:fatty acid binding protein 7, brain, a [Silurus asotus]|uniref:Fatty acid binding protein 7, brain, a n=1 Tax=Silurus asotus TaxID=30991 RepID=A0AAD5A5C9_SILAS|nr:fatty acid binding protein 7, brain, a [Silurus asotus]
MDIFFGSWKLVKSVNMEKLLRASDCEEEEGNVIQALKPVISFSQENDHLVKKTQTIIGTKIRTFQLGEEFQEESLFGQFYKTVINLDGEKLIQVYKCEGGEVTVLREIQNKDLIMTLTCDEATAVLTFQKV